MAGNANFDSILSTTLKKYRREFEDNVFYKTPFFGFMNMSKEKKKHDGGERIIVPVMYGNNSTASSYSKYGVIDTTPQEGLSAAEYTWRQYSVSITISGKEERQNSGETQIINLLEAKTQQAEMSLKELFNADLFADAGDSSQDINGLQALVDVDPTSGVVGGIDRSTETWWRNNSTTGVGSFASNGIDNMRTMYNTCSKEGQDAPDLILTDQSDFERYEKTLQDQMRFTDTKLADAGFQNLRFKDSTMMFDNNCPSGYMYFLNTKYLNLEVHKDADMKVRDFIQPENQDAKTALILWMGNLTMSNASRQGVLSGLTA